MRNLGDLPKKIQSSNKRSDKFEIDVTNYYRIYLLLDKSYCWLPDEQQPNQLIIIFIRIKFFITLTYVTDSLKVRTRSNTNCSRPKWSIKLNLL